MASAEPTPKKKKLNLSLSVEQRKNHDDIQKNKMDNFMRACLKVSYEEYQDFGKRFLLLYIPECINDCTSEKEVKLKQISRSAEQSFKTEFKNKTWYEALEICIMCITSTQYLSVKVLKDIVEIIMNAHEDVDSEFNMNCLLRKCQHTLMMHFNMHPPSATKAIRDCYKNFLSSAMDQNKLSNRTQYLSDKGIVSHCFSRLNHEMSQDSTDGALIEEPEIPKEIDGVKLLHWRKENLELFEYLTRTERIDRIMLVLETVIYLLQIDAVFCLSRKTQQNGRTRSQEPLLRHILWNDRFDLITPLCKTIMKIFAHFIHLRYPERHVKIMVLWVNAVAQMFYINHTHSNDYPNLNSFHYCRTFTEEFYKIISPLPHSSQLRILESIQPSFIQYYVGMCHLKNIVLSTQENIFHIISCYIKNMSWENYPVGEGRSTIRHKIRLKPNKLLDYLSKKCKHFNSVTVEEDYPKLMSITKKDEIDQCYIENLLLLTLRAYLDTYSVETFTQTLKNLNETNNNFDPMLCGSYKITEYFVKQYRFTIKSLQELTMLAVNKRDSKSKKILELIKDYVS